MSSYHLLSDEAREFVDDIIQNSLKANSEMRIKKYFIKKSIKSKYQDFWMLKWEDLIQTKEWVSESKLFEVLNFFFEISERQFKNLDLFNCLACYKWITEKLLEIRDIEDFELSYDESANEKQSGSEMLNEFGYYVSLDTLASGDLLKYNEILSKPYAVIFRKLCLDSTKNLIQKNYLENARRKI